MNDSTTELLGIRKQTHGDFSTHSAITTTLKRVMESEPSWEGLRDEQKEALHMIAHKIGRILAGNPNHKDHWADIAGYARLVEERL